MDDKKRSGFLLRYLLRGLIWLLIIIIVFLLLKDSQYIRDSTWIHAISRQEWLVYIIFGLSEVIFGILPPEFFMIWTIHKGISDFYIINVLFLSMISYIAGIVGYFVGSRFSKTKIFHRVYNKFLHKYEPSFRRYSGFILFVGAVTPLPFSAMCMMVGTINYSKKKFYLITLTRFMRFGVYGYLIWQVNAL